MSGETQQGIDWRSCGPPLAVGSPFSEIRSVFHTSTAFHNRLRLLVFIHNVFGVAAAKLTPVRESSLSTSR
jgi:hypothetical protein